MSNSVNRESETLFQWSPTVTPPPQRSETPIQFKAETGSQPELQKRRVRYMQDLKLKLVQLCIDNQDRYLEMSSLDEYFRFIRMQFAPHAGLEPLGDGTQLRQKIKGMVTDRQAAIAAQKLQSGVAIATTDLDHISKNDYFLIRLIWIPWLIRDFAGLH